MQDATGFIFAAAADGDGAEKLADALAVAYRQYAADAAVSPNGDGGEGGAVAWVLPSYAAAHINAAAERVRSTRGDCCLIIGLNEKVPFAAALRRRAKETLGEGGIAELPSMSADALSAELARGNVDIVEPVFRRLSGGLRGDDALLAEEEGAAGDDSAQQAAAEKPETDTPDEQGGEKAGEMNFDAMLEARDDSAQQAAAEKPETETPDEQGGEGAGEMNFDAVLEGGDDSAQQAAAEKPKTETADEQIVQQAAAEKPKTETPDEQVAQQVAAEKPKTETPDEKVVEKTEAINFDAMLEEGFASGDSHSARTVVHGDGGGVEGVEIESSIDLKKIAMLLGMPLDDWYKQGENSQKSASMIYLSPAHMTRNYEGLLRVLRKDEAIRSIVSDAKDRFRSIGNFMDKYSNDAEKYHYGLSYKILLCDLCRKMGVGSPHMYENIIERLNLKVADDRKETLRNILEVLQAETYAVVYPSVAEEFFSQSVAKLTAAETAESDEERLYAAVLLRVALSVKWDGKAAAVDPFHDIIGKLTEEQVDAIGGTAAFMAVKGLKLKMQGLM